MLKNHIKYILKNKKKQNFKRHTADTNKKYINSRSGPHTLNLNTINLYNTQNFNFSQSVKQLTVNTSSTINNEKIYITLSNKTKFSV